MKIRLLLALAGLAIGFVVPTFAQQAKDLVGTWTLVSITLEKDGKSTDGIRRGQVRTANLSPSRAVI